MTVAFSWAGCGRRTFSAEGANPRAMSCSLTSAGTSVRTTLSQRTAEAAIASARGTCADAQRVGEAGRVDDGEEGAVRGKSSPIGRANWMECAIGLIANCPGSTPPCHVA